MRDIYQKHYFRGYLRPDRPVRTENGIRKIIQRVAEAHSFELSPNLEKIINAKLTLCKGDYKKCPCDHTPESKRYCGGSFCLKEIKKTGRCHCGLYVKKDVKK